MGKATTKRLLGGIERDLKAALHKAEKITKLEEGGVGTETRYYLMGWLEKLIEDKFQPGSVASLRKRVGEE